MRILLALPCCCSCRQAMATELKKQKPLEGGERSCLPVLALPRLWGGFRGLSPPHTTSGHLPNTLHGCRMICMVSRGSHHSKAILKGEK